MLGFAKKLFGSSNERKVKAMSARVARINALEPEYAALSDEALKAKTCLLYTSPSPRDRTRSRMPSSA